MWRVLSVVALFCVVGCGGKSGSTIPHNGDKKDADKKGSDDLPIDFSDTDIRQTFRWIRHEYDKAKKSFRPGNELANAHAEKQFQTAISTMVGRPVRWTMKINGISKDSSVTLDHITWSRQKESHESETIYGVHYYLGVASVNGGFPARAAKREWLLAASVGDPVLVTGVVVDFSSSVANSLPRDSLKPGIPDIDYNFLIRLKDGGAEKP